MFVRTGKYNIECIRQTDFVNKEPWIKLLKYINYNRYAHKLYVAKQTRLKMKSLTTESVIESLRRKTLLKTDAVNALKVSN